MSAMQVRVSIGVISLTFVISIICASKEDFRNEIFVRFKPEVNEGQKGRLFEKFGLTLIEKYPLVEGLCLCRIESGVDVDSIIQQLIQQTEVVYAERNQKVKIAGETSVLKH